jgi:hypothetical protein
MKLRAIMSNRLDWEDTDFLLNLIKQEFVRQHNKPKEQQVEKDFVALRRLSQELGDRRIVINVERMKCLRTS